MNFEDMGKGIWIWKIKDVEGGSGAAAAAYAKDHDIGHIIVKVLSGPWKYNQRPVYKNGQLVGWVDDVLKPFIQEFKAVGIQVWGFQYVYHVYVASEARAAVARVEYLGLDGFVIDAEKEVKNRYSKAVEYAKIIGPGIEVPTALSSYRFPPLHPELPWDAYLGICDLVMPQVYWEGAHNSGIQLMRCYKDYREYLKTDLPIVPAAPTYGRGSWYSTPDDVINFMDTAKELNLPAVNFWRWVTASRITDMWDTIEFYKWDVQPPPDGCMDVNAFIREYLYPMAVEHGYDGPVPCTDKGGGGLVF